VFGSGEAEPAPAAILEHLQDLAPAVRGDFTGDAAGWYAAVFTIGPGQTVQLERFLSTEEGICGELQSWAAWLETCDHNTHSGPLMERVIQTRQLFTLHPAGSADDAAVELLCAGLCRFLAQATGGVWQADGKGFLDAGGTVLVAES
jgi:hypothetical protein